MKHIKLGDNSPEVKDLQEKLSLLGYNLNPDSDFGNNTLTALNQFQTLNQLPISDFVDDVLYNKIIADIDLNSTIDKSSLSKIMELHPKIRFEVLHLTKKCYAQNLKIRIVQGLRTFAEQDGLYAQGRTKPGPIVTNARGGFSCHCYGLAIDFCLLKNGGSISWDTTADFNNDHKSDWIQIVDIFKENGYESGMSWKFKDNPHLEKTFNCSIKQLLNLYNMMHVDKEGYVII